MSAAKYLVVHQKIRPFCSVADTFCFVIVVFVEPTTSSSLLQPFQGILSVKHVNIG